VSIFEIDRTDTSKYLAIPSGDYIFDTKYCILKSGNNVVPLSGLKTDVDLFYLMKGTNSIEVLGVNGISNPTISYTPMYRVGGF
jgi:hypothetical protein